MVIVDTKLACSIIAKILLLMQRTLFQIKPCTRAYYLGSHLSCLVKTNGKKATI